MLKGEFDVMMFQMEEAAREKVGAISKRVNTLERGLKNKQKIIEQKAKDIKVKDQTQSNAEEKLKSKVSALEKQGEFMKAKNIDLEKKLAQEREATTLMKTKNDKLQQKIAQLEKSLKEHSESQSSVGQTPKGNKEVGGGSFIFIYYIF